MKQPYKIAALIPMRHNSVRVPMKNYRLLAGKPLYQHIIATLLLCPEISEVAVDTDSPVIVDGLRAQFPQVRIIERPVHLTADTVPMNEILMYDTGQIKADFYLQTHSTNPLLRPETISRALRTFIEHYPAYDSLFSVTRVQTRFWDALARPVNHNPAILLRTQDLPPLYEENSCLYLFKRQTLELHRTRIGERPYMFEIEKTEAQDIDEESDFLIADLLLADRLKSEKKGSE
ncbi:MAG: acylneuraminate cytidylyltransferase [Chloroflexi bacterium GWB2_54_36]|nr:MAG: acylneuraminate cytidylyltransferase [Chloroflexi bacterium GWB2_54_36]HBA91228.1 acylneuraminate cytidylyltransferase [Anaerolineaceae bacterium]